MHVSRVNFTAVVQRQYEIANLFFKGHRDYFVSWLPFITRDGILDAHIITDEISKSISALSPREVKVKGVSFMVGNGAIRFKLDGWLGNLMGINAISINSTDLDELAKLINNEI